MPILTPNDLAKVRAAKRGADAERQKASVIRIGDATIQIAIGNTNGAPNVGWEVIRPGRADQYFATKERAIAAVGAA